ncbi:proteasome subunit alpha type-3-like protein [Tanacetum coccineum]
MCRIGHYWDECLYLNTHSYNQCGRFRVTTYEQPSANPGFFAPRVVQEHNMRVQPFGSGVILGGYDRDGPQLYMVEPSGVSYGLLVEHQRWSKVSEATTIRSSDSTGMLLGTDHHTFLLWIQMCRQGNRSVVHDTVASRLRTSVFVYLSTELAALFQKHVYPPSSLTFCTAKWIPQAMVLLDDNWFQFLQYVAAHAYVQTIARAHLKEQAKATAKKKTN